MTIEKAKLYKTAKAIVSCASFKAGEFVAVENPWKDNHDIIWFDIVKTETGDCPRTAYPEHHLSQFCL